MAVRIRMKPLGRKHRPYYRIVAIDSRQPTDGRALEELGTYDPMVRNTDDRVTLRPSRIKYWLSVGALPSEKLAVLFRKYMKKWEALEQQQAEAATQPPPPPVPATSGPAGATSDPAPAGSASGPAPAGSASGPAPAGPAA